MLRRYSPMRQSRGTVIPASTREFVERRDRICVGAVVGMPGDCGGSYELDHVRASGGLGLKSQSTEDNLVRLCSVHHRVKTEDGRRWRPVLIDYLTGRL
jgi:hypothetical protein